MFTIGIIVKPQGIRGELRVLPTTDDPSRFSLLEEVFIRHKTGEPGKYTLTASRQQKGMVILTLAGVTDRNAAEALVGGELLIPDEWALPLGEDEYYVRDLIGLGAWEEDGGLLGEIADVLRTGANDVYIIKPSQGNAFMVPAIKDVVREVDMAQGRVTVRLMDGLKELKP
ncbi:MAG: ribosome maturation factor RimM [Defluviitaleaceae bacterium]|nr:ribosome maturation factor RimM [Defluviitaleaceae bacterium]MCL2240014.1 ribosome maturation factor RimM [Defluviitaleaceae bacterium]